MVTLRLPGLMEWCLRCLSLSRTHSNIQTHMQSFNASGICLKDQIYDYYSIYTIVQGRMMC